MWKLITVREIKKKHNKVFIVVLSFLAVIKFCLLIKIFLVNVNYTCLLKQKLFFGCVLTCNVTYYIGSGSEWHSDKMTRSSNRHGASLWHGGSLWHGDKMTQCVNLAQRQNDTVRHFGTVCHFGTEGHFSTATKCLSFIFFSNFVLGF